MMTTYNIPIGKPKSERPLTGEECVQLFGESAAVKMNFIPEMMQALACEVALNFCDECKARKVSSLKKINRTMKAVVKARASRVEEHYGGRGTGVYGGYVVAFFKEIQDDLLRAKLEFNAEAKRQMPRERNTDLCALITMGVMVIRFVLEYDRQMDALIAEKVQLPTKQKPDAFMMLLLALFQEVADNWNYCTQPTALMGLHMKIIANKASLLVDKFIEAEKQWEN